MRLIYSSILILSIGFYSLQTNAEEGGDIPAPLPEAPGEAVEGQGFEPEVTIIRRKETLVEEYRHNGTLYMIKITPKRGYPYYLIDSDGDGSLETRRNELDNPEVVQWRLFSW